MDGAASVASTRPQPVVIRPPKRWVGFGLRELWRFRELLLFLAWRDLKVRYKQTILGVAWAVLQPVLYTLVATLFFKRLLGVYTVGPYVLLALAGFVFWLRSRTRSRSRPAASSATRRSSRRSTSRGCSRRSGRSLAGVVDLAALDVAAPALHGRLRLLPGPEARLGRRSRAVLVAAATAVGVGSWLAALNVKYRDIRFVVPFMLQLWLFASSVFITFNGLNLSEPWRTLYWLNPMAGAVEVFRWSMLGRRAAEPSPTSLLSAASRSSSSSPACSSSAGRSVSLQTSSEPRDRGPRAREALRARRAAVLHGTLRDAVDRAARRVLHCARDRGPERDTIWALDHVTFDITRGEAVGIVGRNGAGKTTLLKILSGITEPTDGEARVCGRVGSLLEVGTGFHPDLTGRENIFLNGAILGMRRGEIMRKFDEIVAFAEVERFIDTPVKRYSSGMYLRLAFSVAAHLEPEILLVDEVLAVGDASFQRKCIGKMGDVAGEGRTVLFVSHNMAAIRSLTQRTLWLERGALVEYGPTSEVVSRYLVDDRRLDRQRRRRADVRGVPSRRLEADGAQRQLRLACAARGRGRADRARSGAHAAPLRHRAPGTRADPLPRDRACGSRRVRARASSAASPGSATWSSTRGATSSRARSRATRFGPARTRSSSARSGSTTRTSSPRRCASRSRRAITRRRTRATPRAATALSGSSRGRRLRSVGSGRSEAPSR